MALTKVTEPFAVFTDTDGSPLDGGFIYVGTVDQNPETSPITVYYDEALSIPVAQPLRTSNGYVMRSGSPAVLYVDADYSITVRDKNGALVIATQSNVGVSPGGALIAANNLSDVDNAAASLVNLGLTATAAELNQIDGKLVIGTDTNILTTPTITGQALKYLRVNAGETAAEFAAIPSQLQATWNTGTDTTESLISPLKLDDKIASSREKGGTPVATTSGTAFDFTGIPAEVQEIEVLFVGVSLSGTDQMLVQLGTSGGLVTSGYISSSSTLVNGNIVGVESSTSGMLVRMDLATRELHGILRIKRLSAGSNTWVSEVNGRVNTTDTMNGGGSVTLAAEVDRIRLTRTGTNTFDAGQVNVRWK